MYRSKAWTVLVETVAVLATPCGQGAENSPSSSIWYGAEAGASNVTQSLTGSRTRSSEFSMALRGGIVLTPQFLLGAEVGGFLLEASNLNDPERGRGISQVFVVAEHCARPGREGLFGKAGLGYASYWGLRSGDTNRSGWGGSLALGHGTVTAGHGAFGPMLTFTAGRFGDMRYRAVSIGLNWSSL